MRITTLFMLLAVTVASDCPAQESVLPPQLVEVSRIERLSQEQKYENIFDGLGSEYRGLVDRSGFIKKSRYLGWKMTKVRMGTVTEDGDTAYAPVRCETLVGSRKLVIDTVAFFVQENGKWRLWNFPFVNPELLDRPSVYPPVRRPSA